MGNKKRKERKGNRRDDNGDKTGVIGKVEGN